MKKVIIGAVALVVIAGTVVFASSTSKTEAKPTCNDKSKCCKVTPDCQPGDPNCVCPMMCDEKK